MRIKISLIVATLGRVHELDLFFSSLTTQTVPLSFFEVIVVDQNDGPLIDQVIKSYEERISIQHIRSSRKGLSVNRNIGIGFAKGDYLAVPDDDCTYYPDTLETAIAALEEYNQPDMLIGKVFNRKSHSYVFKKTPDVTFSLNRLNFYKVVSSITLIFKNDGILFDENFGIGEKYQSNEDGDLILKFLAQGKKVVYSPALEFDHPPYDASTMSVEKLYRYGIGFGAMCRKYISLPLILLFFKVLLFQLLMFFKELVLLRPTEAKRRWKAFTGRVIGFFIYR